MKLEITFAGEDTSESILNSRMIPPSKVSEAARNGQGRLCSVSSRVLTVSQGDQVITTAEDFEHEANAATGALHTLAALHRAGVIEIASINGVPVK